MINRIHRINIGQLFNTRTIVLGLLSFIVIGLVVFPSIYLALGSFSKYDPFSGKIVLTLNNYRKIFEDTYYLTLVWNTFWVAIWTTVLAVIIGSALAWTLSRTNVPLRGLLSQLVMIPFFVSPFVGAICWSLLAAPKVGIINLIIKSIFPSLENEVLLNAYSSTGLIFCETLYFTPFVFLFTYGALNSMDPSMEESSRMCGANNGKTAVKITLPLVLPAISGGALMVFILSVGHFGIPSVLGVPGRFYVLTTEMFVLLQTYPPNYMVAAAVGVFLFGLTAILVTTQTKIISSRQFITVTGKGYRPKIIDMGKWRIVLFAICVSYIVLSVFLPLGAAIWVSLINYVVSKLNMATYTFTHYKEILFVYPPTQLAIKNSMILAFLGATIGMILTGGIALVLYRTNVRGRKFLEYVTMFPIAIPSVVFAVALLWTWINVTTIYGTIWLLLIAYITVYMPYGLRSASATLVQIDKSLEECAYVCGSSWFHTLRTITIPLLKPGIIAGWTLLFICLSSELSSSLFLGTSKSIVISVALWDLYFEGLWEKIGALAVIQTIIIFIVLALARKIGREKIKLG